jgi:small GTP-binding protein
VKIAMGGEIGVGKTWLIDRYVNGTEPKIESPTIGSRVTLRLLPIHNQVVRCEFWDTGGQERYGSLSFPQQFRDAHRIVLVYDVTQRETFKALSDWLKDVRDNAPGGARIYIIGNKCDLPEREVARVDGEAFAEREHLLHFDTSAKNGAQVRRASEALLTEIVQRDELLQMAPASPGRLNIEDRSTQSLPESPCC